MPIIMLYILNGIFLLYLTVSAFFFVLSMPFIFLAYKIIKRGQFDDAIRFINYLFAWFLIRISWPIVQVQRTGLGNMPKDDACVLVVNHRSTSDMFFGPLYTTSNTAVFVRSWPFKLWGISWFMRNAQYIDVEKTVLTDFLDDKGRDFCKRGVSLLFFPEGHRSRTGKLQRFKSGAFQTATTLNIPIIPICMKGTEKFLCMDNPIIRPAKITVDILPPVYPSQFPDTKRALKMKLFVESLFKGHLNE